MPGNKNSGRGPQLANAARTEARAVAEKEWRKFMNNPDPEDLSHPSRMRKIFAKFYESCMSGPAAHKSQIAALAWYMGKPVTPMELEVSRSPEESVDAILEALSKLKESEENESIQ